MPWLKMKNNRTMYNIEWKIYVPKSEKKKLNYFIIVLISTSYMQNILTLF
jgi:hypothetical protein